ncbi:phosphoserine phosphatase SerB [Aestuariimicrobium sp. Y1814]|uniref:phosphoserine phosphatase SerB n=1 Tax=Aestuariimicrobium sp. Y1814 TaxID=3418742 RepID=UPI003DA7907A
MSLDQQQPQTERVVRIGPGLPPADLPHARAHEWGWAADAEPGSAAADHPLADHGRVSGWLAANPPRLVVCDVDATFCQEESIDLLAEVAGAGEHVAEITERAMRGELEFGEALALRVATLAGLPVGALDEVRAQIHYSPGALELVSALHEAGSRVALVSGGFIEIVSKLGEVAGVDFAAANVLEVDNGVLTGRTVGATVDRAAKARFLRQFAEQVGASPDQCVAIGDGANDLDMMAVAGLGIAYCAKPAAAAQAGATISFPRLDAALGYLQLAVS